jgi:uncharacterized protein (TIGR02646 family)
LKVVRQTDVPRYADYARYKPLLRKDFYHRCAYCQHHERTIGQIAAMSIDHFRPKSLFPHLRVKYENLYYCCGECNTYKNNKWPTQEQLDAGESFLDVCEHEWDDHLEVRADVTTGTTSIGKFTAEQVRLHRRKLSARNRSLRTQEAKIRSDLARVDGIRDRSGSGIDGDTARDLDELEQSLQTDLRAMLSPAPLED